MKRLIYCAAALVTVLFAGSCNKELETALGGDSHVTFTVSTGEVATKADIADGTNVNALHWEIYLKSNRDIAEKSLGKGVVVLDEVYNEDKTFTVNLNLVADQEYSIIFWAQKKYNEDGTNPYYDVTDLRKVKIDYAVDKDKFKNVESVDDEDRAAFFAVHDFDTKNGPVNETVELKRPFAQLNLGATNLETSLNNVNGGVIIIESTDITVKNVAYSFDTLNGKGDDQGVLTYKRNRTPYYDYKAKLLNVNGNDYHWLSMNYLAVYGELTDNVALDIKVNTTVGTVQHTITNVPVKENHRTNILGDLLTTAASFQVVVDEEFDKPDITPADILKKTLEKGGTFTLFEDMTIDQTLVVNKGTKVVLDLNGHTITNKENNKETDVIIVDEGADLVINGPGLVEAVSGNDGYAVISKGNLTINGGTFKSGLDKSGYQNAVIYSRHENAVINITGGEFICTDADASLPADKRDYRYTVNKWGSALASTINITGGKFYMFDPNNNLADSTKENPVTDYVPDSHMSVQEGDYYVVVPVKK